MGYVLGRSKPACVTCEYRSICTYPEDYEKLLDKLKELNVDENGTKFFIVDLQCTFYSYRDPDSDY